VARPDGVHDGLVRTIRIGAGAGFADDRVEPAVELAEHGDLDYLVFECLAERTIALAQLDRLRDPEAGFNEWLAERMAAVLPACAHRGTKIITNMGAANPLGAAHVVAETARKAGLTGLRIAAVTGDDVLGLVETDGNTVPANAYLGREPVAAAPIEGTDTVSGNGRQPVITARAGGVVRVSGNRYDPAAVLAEGKNTVSADGREPVITAPAGGADTLSANDCLEREPMVAALGEGVNTVSANAYLGCEPVVAALAEGADVVVTGRIADPSLFLAPLVHEFGWALDDWDRLGKGICLGHLLECAGQVTGGYFADPGFKDVPGLARLGFPLAEASEDGTFVVTKVPGSGGEVTVATCTEQLLYEIHDPAAYVSADVVADFSDVALTPDGYDRVRVTGATGRRRPDRLKVSVGYLDGFLGVGEISYAGPNAVARGRLALDIARERLGLTEAQFDLIGVDSVHRGAGTEPIEPQEVRVRVAGRTATMDAARRIGREVSALWLNGPAGGAGATRRAEQVVAIRSTFVDRAKIRPEVSFVEV
jgi:hypothetical protein